MIFSPPPLIKKPPHPFTRLVKPAWTKKVYALGLVLWIIAFHLLWFVFLGLRYVWYQGTWYGETFSFWPMWFWRVELLVVILGVLSGHVMTMIVLVRLLSTDDDST